MCRIALQWPSMKAARVPNPKNIRFDDATIATLSTLAERFSLTRSDLVREAVKQKLREWKESGVIIMARGK